MKRFHAAAVSLVLVAALTACTPAPPEPTSTPTVKPSSSASKPTATLTPTPTARPLTIADCETMLPLARARDLFSANTEFLGERPKDSFTGRQDIVAVPAVLASSSLARVCFWGIPNSGGLFFLTVAAVTADERASLQGEMTAAGYSQTTTGTVTAFELEGMNEVGSVGFTHLFTGDVWIMCDGVSLSFSGQVAGQGLDAMRTANPTLGL